MIRRAQRGEEAAFAALYRQHRPWVHATAARIARSEAEELVQETFLRVWKALPGFRHESGLRTWIHRICLNVCLRTTAKRVAARSEELSHDLPSLDPDPPTVAILRAQVADVAHAIAKLPDEQRAAVVLRGFEGLSYREIATTLDISLTSARTRIHRGRSHLLSQQKMELHRR